MPVKRRITKSRRVPLDIFALFAVGCGMVQYTSQELADLWKEWGDRILDEHKRKGWEGKPFYLQLLEGRNADKTT